MKLSEAIEGCFRTLSSEGYARDTLTGYRSSLNTMIEYLGDRQVDEVSTDDLRSFMSWLVNGYTPERRNNPNNKDPLSTASHHRYWKAMRCFFKWANRDLGLDRPDVAVKMPRWSNEEIIPLTEDECRLLIKGCEYAQVPGGKRKPYQFKRPNHIRDKAIILTLLDTGVRAGELCRLRISDVDPDSGEVYVRAFHVGKTRARSVYLGKAAKRAVVRYLIERGKVYPDDLLFVTREDHPLTREQLLKVVSRLGANVGVKNVHPHRFRHTFAVQYLRNGGDPFTLKRLLGHSTLEIVNRYLNLVRSDLRQVHQSASPVDRWRL